MKCCCGFASHSLHCLAHVFFVSTVRWWEGCRNYIRRNGCHVAVLTLPVLVAFASWIIAAKTTKMVSLASLVSSFVLFASTVVLVMVQSSFSHAWPLVAVTFLISVMVFWKHRSNIGRIMQSEEPKLGGTKK